LKQAGVAKTTIDDVVFTDGEEAEKVLATFEYFNF
jgi:hypothetical protein